MAEGGQALDLIFGVGFKVGFLIVLVGLILFFIPVFNDAMGGILGYFDFWQMYSYLPPNAQVILAGMMLVGAAVIVGALRDLVSMLVRGLFYRDGADF